MIDKFLLQSGNFSGSEKIACVLSPYQTLSLPLESLPNLDVNKYKCSTTPVGTVEFVREYCRVFGLELPEPLGFPDFVEPYLNRNIRQGVLAEASEEEFVKPRDTVKLFTGSLKKDLAKSIDPSTRVWISEPTKFESEFRFYIQDTIQEPKVLGWSRYDDLEVTNPDPDFEMIARIANAFHQELGPNAYSIDIGWRPDIQKYSLIELNDAWSLGFYNNTDSQSNPPTSLEYSEMLVSRWYQILFCNLV